VADDLQADHQRQREYPFRLRREDIKVVRPGAKKQKHQGFAGSTCASAKGDQDRRDCNLPVSRSNATERTEKNCRLGVKMTGCLSATGHRLACLGWTSRAHAEPGRARRCSALPSPACLDGCASTGSKEHSLPRARTWA